MMNERKEFGFASNIVFVCLIGGYCGWMDGIGCFTYEIVCLKCLIKNDEPGLWFFFQRLDSASFKTGNWFLLMEWTVRHRGTIRFIKRNDSDGNAVACIFQGNKCNIRYNYEYICFWICIYSSGCFLLQSLFYIGILKTEHFAMDVFLDWFNTELYAVIRFSHHCTGAGWMYRMLAAVFYVFTDTVKMSFASNFVFVLLFVIPVHAAFEPIPVFSVLFVTVSVTGLSVRFSLWSL